MFRTRLISGIVLVVLALAVIITGGTLLAAVLLCISLIGMFELYRATNVEAGGMPLLTLGAYAGAILYYVLLWRGWEAFSTGICIGVLILCMTIYVFTYPRYRSEQVVTACFGFMYVAVMLSHIYLTRKLPDGAYTVWLIFLCSWGCDTFAYCSGMLFGKHKMSPKLSPKKSVEGAVGGVLGAALLGALFALIFGGKMSTGKAPVGAYAILCAVGALISMVGDLAASAIKRNTNIKDYGKLIPGHGGILDRFDSVIFTAPVIYYLARLLL